MRRYLGLWITLCACLLVQGARAQKSEEKQGSFTFLDISNVRQGEGDNSLLRQFAEQQAALPQKPAFVIDNGNLTLSGKPTEFAQYKAGIAPLGSGGIGHYAVPGADDIRWNPEGKEGFVHAVGKLYQSFDYAAAHFILLDSTVYLEAWGHFDHNELDWLDKDLKRVKPTTPIFVFVNHPIHQETPVARLIDNDYDLAERLQGHNVVAIFMGGAQEDAVWKINGITALAARGLADGSYYRVSVSPLIVSIDRIETNSPQNPIHIANLPVSTKTKPSLLQVVWDDPNIPYLARRRPTATFQPRAITDNPDREKGEYRVDSGDWKPLTKDRRDFWSDTFQTHDLVVGIHTADIRLTTSNDVSSTDELIFEVERNNKEATRKWATDLGGPIQSDPLLQGDTLYVSCVDGKLYALNTANYKRRWIFPSRGAFVASPVLHDGVVYIGSTDHTFYAIEAASGHVKWHVDTESAFFSTAAAANGVVCVGGNGVIYGFDANTGDKRWTRPAGGFFQGRVATDGNSFYLGGWDNTFYAFNLDGSPKWSVKMGREVRDSPAVASPCVGGGKVYICSGDGVLHCLNASDGNEVWTRRAPEGGDPFGAFSPVLCGKCVVLGGKGAHGDVYALDAVTRDLVWHVTLQQPLDNTSARVAPNGQSLAIMALRGRIAVLSAATGSRLWGYELGPGNIFSTPEYDGSLLYTVTMADDVQAINGPGVGE